MKAPKCLVYTLYAVLACIALALFIRYILPLLAPFLIALCLAAAMEPAVGFMTGRGNFPRSMAAGICTLLLLGVIFSLLTWVIGRASSGLVSLSADLPELLTDILDNFRVLKSLVSHYISSAPDAVGEYLRSALDALESQLAAVPAWLSAKLPAVISFAVEKTPSTLLMLVTLGLGVYFISASYPNLKDFILRQIPERFRSEVQRVRRDLKATLGKWLKAQLILMAVTFFELILAFSLLKLRCSVALAAVTALVDALPILGAGTVLLPWSLWCFLSGESSLGVGLVVTYAAITLLRSCFEAKLVGDQLGLHPLVSLFSIYVGFRVCGVLGMFAFPIIAVTACKLNDSGIIKLWK